MHGRETEGAATQATRPPPSLPPQPQGKSPHHSTPHQCLSMHPGKQHLGTLGPRLPPLWDFWCGSAPYVISAAGVVYIAQRSVQLEQHAFLSTKGAMKNTLSGVGGAGWAQRPSVPLGPHSDGLLQPEALSVMLSSELAQPQAWELLKWPGTLREPRFRYSCWEFWL